MEVSEVRKRVRDTLERARRNASERRAKGDHAQKSFDAFLNAVAIPIVKQVANILQAERHAFTVFTPSGSVRLSSDRGPDDFIEIFLDTSGETPRVLGHVKRSRGRRVLDAQSVIGSGDPDALTEEELLTFLLKELEPFVDR